MSPIRPTVTVVGRRMDHDAHRVRDFLTRVAQPYRWLEAGTPGADDVLAEHGLTDDDVPLVLEEDGAVLRNATVARLAEAWGESQPPPQTEYDLAIVGAGPAGLAAAVYAASDGLSTIVLEADVPGGQASHTSKIENFFGFPGGIGGAELARLAGRQAEGFGAHLSFLRPVVGSGRAGDDFEIEVAGGHTLRAPVVIAAPGMLWRRLEADGFEDFLGRGAYYGAGRSEAAQCTGDPVVVVGAGNSAGQAVMDLANANAEVAMVVRGDDLGRSMSRYLVDRIQAHPNVDVRLRTEVARVEGNAHGELDRVLLRERGGGAEQRVAARALFACIGGVPRTGWADAVGVAHDAAGYILTGPDLLVDGRRPDGWPLDRDPLALETNIPGLFAAGDARHGSTKRVAGAVGEGAMATALAHRRLAELRGGA